MIRGLYTSAIGMTAQMKKMDIVTNNIANADTNGFKKDIAITQSFSEELMKRLDDSGQYTYKKDRKVGKVSQGVFINSVHTDFSNGNLKQTGGDLDLAILGSGFFSIDVKDKKGISKESYSRDGVFTLSNERYLVTKEGYNVLGENGPIQIPDGDIDIDENGNISVNGEFVDKIKMVDFDNLESLRKVGDSLYDITNESTEKPFTSIINQGFVENSNINSVKEMVDLITVSRVYEANQKLITMIDTTLGQAVNDIGKK